jgi:hypothetical protein
MLNWKIKKLKNSDFINKKFYSNIWIFDISTKSNNLITKIEQMPMSFKLNITLPLLPFNVDGSNWLKLIFNSLKLLTIFSTSKSFLSEFWMIQWNKKWIQGGVVVSHNYNFNNFNVLPLLSLVAFPYIWISEGESKFLLLSDTSGNLTFSFSEISFLAKFLTESYIGWNKPITCNLTFKKIKYFTKLNKYPFVVAMLNRLLWSSLSFKCVWGHGAFTNSSVVKWIFKNKLNNLETRKYSI